MNKITWEFLCEEICGTTTHRLKVVGGWLVRLSYEGNDELCMQFVRDEKYLWLRETTQNMMVSILDTPIESLELSTRVQSALLGDNIKTIGELVICNQRRVCQIPNIGNLSLREINDALQSRGLHLGMKQE